MATESGTTKKVDEKDKPVIAKTPADLQRIRLEKLMKNPDKPVVIPPRPKEKSSPHVPEFVRNVMGSSAGAGSGEFHVYRHLRRKEYARQKFIQEKAGKDLLEEEYHKKIEENRKKAEEATAKKRAKRLKKNKNKKKFKNDKSKTEKKEQKSSESEDSDNDSSNDKDSDQPVRLDSVAEEHSVPEETKKEKLFEPASKDCQNS